MISQEKWDKAKGLLKDLEGCVLEAPQALDRKWLEHVRGFLNYICQTYMNLTPYLIGIHMSIDSWRPGRDSEGWRLNSTSEVMIKLDKEWRDHKGYVEGPTKVRAVPRLIDDIRALRRLMSSDRPILKRVRCSRTGRVMYGFGDASGAGFGATIQIGDEIQFEYGQWASQISEEESSNWRELSNLVSAMKRLARETKLNDCEIFIFTDNSTAEAAFWKGNSKSRKLFELVLELKELEFKNDFILHVIHVSGKRMIEQGTDGLSRGDHSQGVMLGKPMIDFVPLNLLAFDQSPSLKLWLKRALRGLEFNWLNPRGWFTEVNLLGNFVWAPPPAPGDVVVDVLGKSRLKRPQGMHLVIIP